VTVRSQAPAYGSLDAGPGFGCAGRSSDPRGICTTLNSFAGSRGRGKVRVEAELLTVLLHDHDHVLEVLDAVDRDRTRGGWQQAHDRRCGGEGTGPERCSSGRARSRAYLHGFVANAESNATPIPPPVNN
jgi:hypothetical protein